MTDPKGPLLYYITDRKQLGKPSSLLSCIRRAASHGVDFIQIREKDLADGELFELVSRAVAIVKGTRCRILVNGRADIGLTAGAHGVHLPSGGLRVSDLRSWLPRGFLVGISAHSLRDAMRAYAERADYVLLGPVFPTQSKLRYGPPLGLSYLRRVCARVRLPVLGLGGISADMIGAVMETGAAGVAGITLFQKQKQTG
jgi:thiamine-phosphate pyrophosphorylase